MALSFPGPNPPVGTRYPVDPGTSGVAQWEYDGLKWVVVPSLVSLGAANQTAYNSYKWPLTDGAVSQQLTTDGAGNLSWEVAAAPSIQVLSILPSELPFDGLQQDFTLVDSVTFLPYAPNPSTNIVVFLGGVPQTPSVSYSVSGSTISFLEAPFAGTTFYAITNVVL